METEAPGTGEPTEESGCDDTSATASPGAPQLCDGLNNDCTDTTWIEDTEVISFEAEDGTWTDLTGSINPLTQNLLTLDTPGTLHICPGRWPLSIHITASVDIIGNDPERVLLSGGHDATLVAVTGQAGQVTVTGVTLQDGRADSAVTEDELTGGGGLRCTASEVWLRDVRVTDSLAGLGGGIYASDGCDLTLSGVTVDGNTAHHGGGIYASDAAGLTITDSLIQDNTADSSVEVDRLKEGEDHAFGGGLYLYGLNGALLRDTTLARNTITHKDYARGGGAYISQCDGCTLEQVTALGNTITDDAGSSTQTGAYGGGLYISSSDDLTISEAVIDNNTLYGRLWSEGAGLAIFWGSRLTLSDSTIQNNAAHSLPYSGDIDPPGIGGGAYLRGTDELTVTGTRFLNNTAEYHNGAIYAFNNEHMLWEEVHIEDNHAYWRPGFRLSDSTDTTLRNVTVSDNNSELGDITASLYQNTDTTVEGLTFTDNIGGLSVGYPDGLYLSDATFSNNTDTALTTSQVESATLERVVFSGNTSDDDPGALDLSGDTTLTDITLTDNQGVGADGIYLSSGTLTAAGVTASGQSIDLSVDGHAVDYTLGTDAAFTCTADTDTPCSFSE